VVYFQIGNPAHNACRCGDLSSP